MTKPINEFTVDELSKKIEAIKAERERTANALKRYEEELERRKKFPLGAPIGGAISRSFLLWFPSKESADKFDNEYFTNFIKALQDIAERKPIDIKAIAPLLQKGFVCYQKSGVWCWFEDKPELRENWWFSTTGCIPITVFNLKPAKDWRESLMECGLCTC